MFDFDIAVPVPGLHGHDASLHNIVILCVGMYGSIGLLWIWFKFSIVEGVQKEYVHIALLCLTWCSTSVGMHVLNKSLATVLQAPALIAIVQMVIAVLVVAPLSIRNLLEADGRQMRFWLIIPLFFAGMLCSSFYTYSYISLSLLTVIRNLTPLIVLPLEQLVMPPESRPHASLGIVMSILVMLSGALIYAGGLADISMMGVAFAIGNMVIAVMDRLTQRRLLTNECKDLPSKVCTVLNNFLGIFPLLAVAGGTGQLEKLRKAGTAASWLEPRIVALLTLSGLVGIGICYAGLECQRAISATSFFVMQNVSKVAVVTCGVAFFGDEITSVPSMAGLALSLGGSAIYGKIQMDKAQASKAESKKLTS